MLLSYLYLTLYSAQVYIFHKYFNPKIHSYNFKVHQDIEKQMQWKYSLPHNMVPENFQTFSIGGYLVWAPLPRKLQFSFTLSLNNFGYWDPQPPLKFPLTILGVDMNVFWNCASLHVFGNYSSKLHTPLCRKPNN